MAGDLDRQSTQVPSPDEHRIVWWRPGWLDVVRIVGWWWVIGTVVTAAAAFMVALVIVVTGFTATGFLLKPALLLGGGAVAMVSYVIQRAVQARREPFCVACGYCLTGLPDAYRCPECGRPYTWQEIEAYRRDPAWYIERHKALRRLPSADRAIDALPSQRPRRSRDGT